MHNYFVPLPATEILPNASRLRAGSASAGVSGRVIAKTCLFLALAFWLGMAWATPKPATPEWSETQKTAAKASPQTAIFAGGCFWCMEPPYDALDGVLATTSGFTGGTVKNPTYQQVVQGNTGHFEVVKVTYDPEKIGYQELLDVFWRNIDPLDDTGQFCDKGSAYLSAIFVQNAEERSLAEQSRTALQESGVLPGPIVTEILPAATFYPAEEYHQNYYQKNPLRYRFYRSRCGRDQRLQELWGD